MATDVVAGAVKLVDHGDIQDQVSLVSDVRSILTCVRFEARRFHSRAVDTTPGTLPVQDGVASRSSIWAQRACRLFLRECFVY